jgi:hypothetical protein
MNERTWKLHIQLHILPYNVGNKTSWVKNYCEVVVVVARNPSCCSKSQSVYRFCGDVEGDKLLQQQQQHLSKLFTKRPQLLDSQQGERTVPQEKLALLHSPSSPTQNTTKKEHWDSFWAHFLCFQEHNVSTRPTKLRLKRSSYILCWLPFMS